MDDKAGMDDKQIILSFLDKIKLSQGLTPEELNILCECSLIRQYASGKHVVVQDELSDDIYVIIEGKVELTIRGFSENEPFKLATLKSGDKFGEIAFRDGLPRSCTVTTIKPCSMIMISKKQLLERNEVGLHIFERIILNTAIHLSHRMRAMNDTYTKELKHKIFILKSMLQFSRMFVVITVMIGFSSVFLKFLSQYGHFIALRSQWFSWCYLLVLFLPYLYLTIKIDKPISTFGVTLKNAKQSLYEALITIVIIAPALIYLCGYTPSTLITRFLSPFSLLYLIHAAIQEFVARGVIQTSLSHFAFNKAKYTAIALASFYFAIFHLHIGFQAFMITFVVGLLFGFLYYRHKTLIGVTLVHYVLGWIALGALI